MTDHDLIKVHITTPNDSPIIDETDFIVCKTDEGEIGFQKNHSPLIGRITEGFVRYNNKYVAIKRGIIDYKDNELIIICQNAHTGETYQEALKLLEEEQHEILAKSKRKLVDFTQAERDLVKCIKEAGAGRIAK